MRDVVDYHPQPFSFAVELPQDRIDRLLARIPAPTPLRERRVWCYGLGGWDALGHLAKNHPNQYVRERASQWVGCPWCTIDIPQQVGRAWYTIDAAPSYDRWEPEVHTAIAAKTAIRNARGAHPC